MSNLLSLIQENREAILQEWLQGIQEVSRKRGLIDERDCSRNQQSP